MMKKTLDFSKLQAVSLEQRKSKVHTADFSQPLNDAAVRPTDLIRCFPQILAARDFRHTVAALRRAREEKKTIVWMMGAHVIKCGLSPLLIDLMDRGYIGAVALNGAGAIHDFELAFCGKTSEDVEAAIQDGSFGMSRETADFFNEAVPLAARPDMGLGQTCGELINRRGLPHRSVSLLAAARSRNIPLTVHVAVGTDIFHSHAACSGAALGQATMNDFRRFCEVTATIEQGVVLNIGSAVILPEVFLKALSAVRNLGVPVQCFTAVCFDMIKQYRSWQNVAARPTQQRGSGYYIIGHHEIMIPLLYWMLVTEE